MSEQHNAEPGGESANKMLLRINKDMYYGNGKPGITTRVQQAEDKLVALDECDELMTKRINGVENKFWAIILLLITILGGVVTDIITKGASHT